MKIMIMAGGTGGHVFPALAVAEELRRLGHEIVWMGAPDSFEACVVPQHGLPIEFIRVSGLRGKGISKLLSAPLLLWHATADALRVLRRQAPQVVLGMGGFAAGPGGVGAWLLRIPLVIHEQNAAAGMTNRLLASIAARVLQAFPGTFKRALTVGNPVRAGFAGIAALGERVQHEGARRVLVIGGSQGARALNELMPQALALMPAGQRPEVRHQAGRTLEIAQASYTKAGMQASVEAFISDMPAAYGWADLVVCRAGASTIAELAAAGSASLLVPFPAAVDDHQTRNGEYLVKSGAARLLQERGLTPQKLASQMQELLAQPQALADMGEAARACAWRGAAQKIAQVCLTYARTAR